MWYLSNKLYLVYSDYNIEKCMVYIYILYYTLFWYIYVQRNYYYIKTSQMPLYLIHKKRIRKKNIVLILFFIKSILINAQLYS